MRGCKNLSPKEVLPHGPIMFFKIQLLLYIVYNNLGSHIISSSHHNFFLHLSHKHTRIFFFFFKTNQNVLLIDQHNIMFIDIHVGYIVSSIEIWSSVCSHIHFTLKAMPLECCRC